MKNIFLVLLVSFSVSSFAQSIDQSNSKVEFKIGSIMWAKVKGEISNMKGTVKFNEAKPTQAFFDVSINVNTINTDNEKRDTHLKTEDFFDVNKYPQISYKSSSVTTTENGYLSKGKLTIKDITKEVSIPFILVKDGGKESLVGEFEIERLDYNVGVDQSTMLVDKKVKLTITFTLQ